MNMVWLSPSSSVTMTIIHGKHKLWWEIILPGQGEKVIILGVYHGQTLSFSISISALCSLRGGGDISAQLLGLVGMEILPKITSWGHPFQTSPWRVSFTWKLTKVKKMTNYKWAYYEKGNNAVSLKSWLCMIRSNSKDLGIQLWY